MGSFWRVRGSAWRTGKKESAEKHADALSGPEGGLGRQDRGPEALFGEMQLV